MRNPTIRYSIYALGLFWLLYLIPPIRRLISGAYEWIATGLGQGYRIYADGVAPLLSAMSANRGILALIVILILLGLLAWSIFVGLRQSRLRDKDEVFGDPERTTGGWYWMICGLASLGLVWFYFSWGAAQAFFPNSANEICQVAGLHTALNPFNGALPPRFYASTEIVRTTHNEIAEVLILPIVCP